MIALYFYKDLIIVFTFLLMIVFEYKYQNSGTAIGIFQRLLKVLVSIGSNL